MGSIKYMDEEILSKKATAVLIKELGPVEAIRFINMPKKKRLESVKRHREWQKSLDKDPFFGKVFSQDLRNQRNHRETKIFKDQDLTPSPFHKMTPFQSKGLIFC
jgi:hypothetical protein